MKHKQKGIGVMGWLVGLALFGFSLIVLFKLLPVYIEDYAIKQAFEKVVNDPEVKTQTPEQIRQHFNKYLITNSIKAVRQDKLIIVPKEDKKNIQLDYEVRTPFVGNIDFIMSFHYQENI